MKVPIFEAPPNFFMTTVPEKKSGQGNGLFGDILNMKLQNFQGESGTDSAAAPADDSTDMIQWLKNVLDTMKELQAQGAWDPIRDEDGKELLQQAIDLLEGLEATEFSEAAGMLGPVLENVILTTEQADSDGEMDLKELEPALMELKAVLEQIESMKQADSSLFQKSGGTPLLLTGQIPVNPNLPGRENIKPANGEGQSKKDSAGIYFIDPENAETEEAKPAPVRLETAKAAMEDPARTATLKEGSEKRAEAGSVQAKADTGSIQASNMNRTETEEVIIRLVEAGSNERKARELIRQFTNVLQRSNFSQSLQTKSLTIRLYPEHLGSLRIELVQRDGAMIARILASTSMAKDMLDSQIHQLRNAFVQQNIQVDKLDISYQEGLDKYSSHDQRSNDQEQPGSDQRTGQDSFDGENDEEEFSKFLQKVLFEMEV